MFGDFLDRIRDIAYLDPDTWLTFAWLATIAIAGSWSLTRHLEWAVLALRNRFGAGYTPVDAGKPYVRREVTLLYVPAIAGVLLGPLLAYDAGGVGFYFAYDQLLHPVEWDWLAWALLPALLLLGLSLVTLALQLRHLLGWSALLVMPLYVCPALAAFAAGAVGAPLVALALLAKRAALVDMPVRMLILLWVHLRGTLSLSSLRDPTAREA
jgi:hypothetical protein